MDPFDEFIYTKVIPASALYHLGKPCSPKQAEPIRQLRRLQGTDEAQEKKIRRWGAYPQSFKPVPFTFAQLTGLAAIALQV